MDSLNGLMLHKCVYFNYYTYIIWALCNGLFLYYKLDYMKIPKLLVVTAYLIMTITFSIKLFLVHHRNSISDISKLTRFFLLTILIQLPLVSFFLIAFPLLLCTPVEICLHVLLLFMTLSEGAISFFVVWKAVKNPTQYLPRSPYAENFPPIELQPVPRVRDLVGSRPVRIPRPRHKRLPKMSSS